MQNNSTIITLLISYILKKKFNPNYNFRVSHDTWSAKLRNNWGIESNYRLLILEQIITLCIFICETRFFIFYFMQNKLSWNDNCLKSSFLLVITSLIVTISSFVSCTCQFQQNKKKIFQKVSTVLYI